MSKAKGSLYFCQFVFSFIGCYCKHEQKRTVCLCDNVFNVLKETQFPLDFRLALSQRVSCMYLQGEYKLRVAVI